jgi:hypothetical protein
MGGFEDGADVLAVSGWCGAQQSLEAGKKGT